MSYEKKQAIIAVMIYGGFLLAGLITMLVMMIGGKSFDDSFGISYWLCIIPVLPTVVAFMLGSRSRETIIVFDWRAYHDVVVTRMIVTFVIGIFICAIIGLPLILYRLIKAIIILVN